MALICSTSHWIRIESTTNKKKEKKFIISITTQNNGRKFIRLKQWQVKNIYDHKKLTRCIGLLKMNRMRMRRDRKINKSIINLNIYAFGTNCEEPNLKFYLIFFYVFIHFFTLLRFTKIDIFSFVFVVGRFVSDVNEEKIRLHPHFFWLAD